MTDPEAVPEPGAVIDPEPAPPTVPAGRRRRVVLAALTALAVVAGGIALVGGDGPSEPEPLALVAGDGAQDRGEGRPEMMTGAAPAVAPAIGSATDSRLAYPSGGWGLEFEVAGDLPDLPDKAPAWRATGPAVDRAAVARIAGALGLAGTPEQRDGGWFVQGSDWTLNAFPGGDTWSISLFRSRVPGPGGALVPDDAPAGPSLSAAQAESRVRELLDRMGAPAGSWKFETAETQIGVGWACAAPAGGPAMSPEELRTLELEKLRQLEPANATAEVAARDAIASDIAGSTTPGGPVPDGGLPADMPAPGGAVGSCPPPAPPVEGFVVALSPLLDGVRADWPVWQVTLRSDGRVESLYGSWVTFERGESYKLRGVSAALKDLQSPAEAPVRRTEGISVDPAGPDTAAAPAGSTAAPCPPATMPLAVEPDAAVSSPAAGCGVAAPQVVTITGVEPALMQAPVAEDGRVRLHLVPAYRFVGHFDNGGAWYTLVLALHPDAIAPPPDMPVTDDLGPRSGGGSTGVGRAVPPMPPGAEPAVISDPDSPR